ncbi:hypothetical protein AK812_SmicGene33489 [Symbiodinium microadriaticum]|uniref:Uncharacterized protein n=1 Tax=Symbiodinium microadriaticum TaxID=2951 RepID=A0A1Q9CRH2_SYMMI|nr:hypothetical protein AK812_SmicGene33489 [Symbiodinium microadriaticum]
MGCWLGANMARRPPALALLRLTHTHCDSKLLQAYKCNVNSRNRRFLLLCRVPVLPDIVDNQVRHLRKVDVVLIDVFAQSKICSTTPALDICHVVR